MGAPAPEGGSPPADETPEQKLARLESENAELRNAAPAAPSGGSGTEPPAGAPPTPLAALKASIEAEPQATFAEHLKRLADDGIKAVFSPSIESDVLAALVGVVHDALKVGEKL